MARIELNHDAAFMHSQLCLQNRVVNNRPWPMSEFGFMNTKGVISVPPTFDYADKFCDGLAPVFARGRWFYIDKSGKEAIKLPTNCSQAFMFSEGRAAVALHPEGSPGGFELKENDRWGFIDVHGK